MRCLAGRRPWPIEPRLGLSNRGLSQTRLIRTTTVSRRSTGGDHADPRCEGRLECHLGQTGEPQLTVASRSILASRRGSPHTLETPTWATLPRRTLEWKNGIPAAVINGKSSPDNSTDRRLRSSNKP